MDQRYQTDGRSDAVDVAERDPSPTASQDSIVTRLIGDHPVAAVAAAATLGAVLGWVIKRR